MNVITIAGRLAADAETRVTPSGLKVTNFRMAVNVRKGGKEETMWWRVTVWGDRYDKMMPYFKKGAALVVVGEMSKPEIWTDKEGRPQVGLEMTADMIRFSPFSSSQDGTGAANQNQGSNTAYGNNNSNNSYGNHNAAPAQHSSYSQPQSGYGNNNHGDFGGSMQGGGSSNYSQSHESEEPIPF